MESTLPASLARACLLELRRGWDWCWGGSGAGSGVGLGLVLGWGWVWVWGGAGTGAGLRVRPNLAGGGHPERTKRRNENLSFDVYSWGYPPKY